MNGLRSELIGILTYQAEWRDKVAEDWPADDRNTNSANACRALAAELELLPDDDASLESAEQRIVECDWSNFPHIDNLSGMTNETGPVRDLFRTLGFEHHELAIDRESFFEALCDAVREATEAAAVDLD